MITDEGLEPVASRQRSPAPASVPLCFFDKGSQVPSHIFPSNSPSQAAPSKGQGEESALGDSAPGFSPVDALLRDSSGQGHRTVCLELFAGCARLSQALRAEGFDTVAVDCKRDGVHPIVCVDLLSSSGRALVWQILRSGRVCYVHMAPPCSTASAARNIPGGPAPLRSFQAPDGLPGLPIALRSRVSHANRLYSFCRDVAVFCDSKDIAWSIENPCSSLMWVTSALSAVQASLEHKIRTVVFDNCCYGGLRKKRTAVWGSLSSLGDLASLCRAELGHVHQPWGRLPQGEWATRSEAAYPVALCKRWAAVVRASVPSAVLSEDKGCTSKASLYSLRASLGLFPKGKHPCEPQNPFSERVDMLVPLDTNPLWLIPGASPPIDQAPKGCKVLGSSRVPQGWVVSLGVPCSPEAFMQKASRCAHPAETLPPLPASLELLMTTFSQSSLQEVQRRRCRFLQSALARASELEPQERALHASMSAHVRHILQGKRLLLLHELLQGLGHADVHLVRDISSGFPLTGWLAPSNVMETKFSVPSVTVDSLWADREKLNAQAWNSTRSTGDADLDERLWQATLDDVAAGWATLDESPESPPSDCILSRRFGVVQGSRLRAIDDFSFSGLNSALGVCEKVTTMSTSHTVALILRLLSLCSNHRPTLKGRCYDLKSAYRQLPIHRDHLRFAAVCVFNPRTKRPAVLHMSALPFGAGASVSNFVRVSLGLWRVLTELALVPCTLFFDDFSSATWTEDCHNLDCTVNMLFRILGWRLATEGSKATPFQEAFQSLGVLFTLSPGADRALQVSNTEARKAEVSEWCVAVLTKGTCSSRDFRAFASRVRWLSGQVFGRSCGLALKVLLQEASLDPQHSARPLSPRARWAVSWILDHVPAAGPKRWDRAGRAKRHLFTDGCFENGVGRIGAVLCDGHCRPIAFMSSTVPTFVVSAWCADGTSHPIIQTELAAVAVAMHLWQPELFRSRTMLWIDNEVCRFALMKGHMFPESAEHMLRLCLEVEQSSDVQLWVCRVPSHSNPADAPSRGDVPAFLQGARSVQVEVGLWRHLTFPRC